MMNALILMFLRLPVRLRLVPRACCGMARRVRLTGLTRIWRGAVVAGLCCFAFSSGYAGSLTLRIENIGSQQTIFAPRPATLGQAIWVVHHPDTMPVFATNTPASKALERFAEDSNILVLFADLAVNPDVIAFGAFQGNDLAEGCAVVAIVNVFAEQVLSVLVPMLQANDKFFATPPNGVRLFSDGGFLYQEDLIDFVRLYDAGTELDEVPGEGSYQGLIQSYPEEGDPQGDVVHRIRTGLSRSRDGYAYPFVNEHLRLTVKETQPGEVFHGQRCDRRTRDRGRAWNIF